MMRTAVLARKLRPDLRTVLGLADPDLPNWREVRLAQGRDTRRMLPLAWATNLFSAIALAAVLWDALPRWEIATWLATLFALVVIAVTAKRPAASRADIGTILWPALRALAGGLIWAVPPVLFGAQGGVDEQVAICFVLGGMIASAPVTLSAMPMAMTCFMIPMAGGLMVMTARTGSPVLIALPPIYALALLVGGLATGRAALRRRWAETALDDEAGLVSLLLRDFADDAADWLWEIDVRKRLVSPTPRLAQAFGRPAAALRDRPLMALLADGCPAQGGHPAELRGLLDLLDARHSFTDHMLPVLIDGEQRWWRLSAMPRFAGDGSFAGYRGVGSDVTEQRRSRERIDRLARADGLTEIDNRMGFTERLRAAIDAAGAGGPPCALILVDLDRFKAVNDTYGHPVGDRLLRAAATRLAGLAGERDACGRLGGDEFAMLIGDAEDAEEIDALCQRIRRVLTQPFELDGNILHVGASIGTALAPRDGHGVETLMRNADLALYRSKRTGRGSHHHFVPALLDKAERRLTIEHGLRRALERDELSLVFQPVVAIASGALTGFEALLRWRHPDLGEVAPAEFVPIAEAARLMAPIGDWVLHVACREAMRWPTHVTLSINLSAGQATDARLPMAIRAALAMSGLAARRLQLEIAESTLLKGGDALIEAMDRLRATGAGLVLDDFGTGFACIRQARFGTIKISRHFLRDANEAAPESIALIRALVTMADALGVDTIVKGAETGDQQALAEQLGCRQVQGFASGSPLNGDEAAMLVRCDEAEQRRVA